MNKTEAAAGGGHAEVENVDRECLSIVTFPGNMTHILLEFIPSSRGVDGEWILMKRQERRMNLIKDIRIFFPFAGSEPPLRPGRRGEHTHERASEMRQ